MFFVISCDVRQSLMIKIKTKTSIFSKFRHRPSVCHRLDPHPVTDRHGHFYYHLRNIALNVDLAHFLISV